MLRRESLRDPFFLRQMVKLVAGVLKRFVIVLIGSLSRCYFINGRLRWNTCRLSSETPPFFSSSSRSIIIQFFSLHPMYISPRSRVRVRARIQLFCVFTFTCSPIGGKCMNQLFRGEGFTPFLPSPLPSPAVLKLYSLFVFHTRCARVRRAMACHGEG